MHCNVCGFPSHNFEAMRTHLEDTHDIVGFRDQAKHVEGDVRVRAHIIV